MHSTPAELAGISEVTPRIHDELVHRVANEGQRWLDQVESTGFCSHPIRLAGTVRHQDKATGEVRLAYSTGAEPDGVLLVRCGNRRTAVCASCGTEHGWDAYQIAVSGLRGGKGVPDTARSHPKLFVTLTAPSFGAVHARIAKGKSVSACHPRRGKCIHGRPLGCFRPHREGDHYLGQPLCEECFDYRGLVVWNALVPELWRRTRINLDRALAKVMGMTLADVERSVKVEYIKVAELQKRGAIHFHGLVRLDARPPDDDKQLVLPPPAAFTIEVLHEAVELAVTNTTAPCPSVGGVLQRDVHWGSQVDIVRLRGRGPGELSEEAVAAYVAKYTTKGSESLAERLDHRLSGPELDDLEAPAHVANLVRAAWDLGADEGLADLKLRKWAHCLGFGGHWATKSRRYSTTFKVLRRGRAVHARARRFDDGVPLDAWDRPEDEDQVVVLAEWQYRGSGYRTQGEKWLALSAAAWARERKRVAKEAMRSERTTRSA
jgi:replication initiator protein RepSA